MNVPHVHHRSGKLKHVEFPVGYCLTISKKQRYYNNYGIGEYRLGFSNLLEQGKIGLGGQGGLPYRLGVFPGGFSFFEEGFEAFGGIVRFH